MIKILVMIAKRPDLGAAEFRDHYEQSHAPLALRYFGHLFLEFRRNYVGVSATLDGSGGENDPGCGYDAITELVLRDQAALDEMMVIYGDAEVRSALAVDEERFMDRKSSRMAVVETTESGAHIAWPTR